jgi:hypothetical protein
MKSRLRIQTLSLEQHLALLYLDLLSYLYLIKIEAAFGLSCTFRTRINILKCTYDYRFCGKRIQLRVIQFADDVWHCDSWNNYTYCKIIPKSVAIISYTTICKKSCE